MSKHLGAKFSNLEVQILVNIFILETLSKFRSPKMLQAHFNMQIFLSRKKSKGESKWEKEKGNWREERKENQSKRKEQNRGWERSISKKLQIRLRRWAHRIRVMCKSHYFPQNRITVLLMSKLKKWYVQKLSFSIKYVKHIFPLSHQHQDNPRIYTFSLISGELS